MNKFKLMLALLGAPCMVLASCGDEPVVTEKKVNSVTVSCSAAEVMIGKTVKASVSVAGQNLEADDKKVSWSSSDESVATVDSTGKVTGKKEGKATITATSTFDSSKSGSVEIDIIPAYWTKDQLAIFNAALPEPIPYIEGEWEVSDDYYEDYGVIIVSSEDKGALAKAKAAFEADENYNYLGTEHDDEYDCDDFYYSKPSLDYLGYETWVDVYELDGVAEADIYFDYIQYEKWPAEQIASYMTLCGINGSIPAVKMGKDSTATAAPEELEDGGKCVYVTVSDEDLVAEDYVATFDSEKYYIVEDEYGYLVSPKDKSYSLTIYDSENFYGIEIIASEYVKDETFSIIQQYEMVEVSKDLQLSVFTGIDIDPAAKITWSVNEAGKNVVSVSESGLVTGLGEGSATITAKLNDEISSETIVYCVKSAATEFSTEQLGEFKKLLEGLTIPFNKYFDEIKYDDKEKMLNISSSFYCDGFDSYYDALVKDGWKDILSETYGDFAELLYCWYGAPFIFEKKVNNHFIDLEYSMVNSDTTYGEYNDFEGYYSLSLYDPYIYSYSDALAKVSSLLKEHEVETTAAFPEALPGTHYSVDYDEEYNSIDLISYEAGNITLDDVVAALKAKGWNVDKFHEDAYVDEYGDQVPAVDGLEGASADGVLEIEGYVYADDKTVALYIYLPGLSGDQLMDIEDLEDGDQIFIVCLDADVGVGPYNGSKNFKGVEICDGMTESLIFDDCTCFTVVDKGDGTWGLEDEDGNAYGVDKSKNIKTSGSGVEFDWTIEIDEDGYATMTCNSFVFMYNNNASSGGMFKAYNASFLQTDGLLVQIFVA